MGWLTRLLSSSIGGKVIVAVTGLMMVGFLVAHLAGNLLVFAGPEALSAYAEGLRKFPLLLWVARLGLLGAAFLHIFFAIKLNLNNKSARPQPYADKRYRKASFASRTMVQTGLLVFFYICYHLLHFTFRATNPEIAALGPYDVHQMLVLEFNKPIIALTYIAALIVTGFHLSHGISSLWQTLGINHTKYNLLLRLSGPVAGFTLAAGFISIPLSVMIGIVK